MHVVRAVTSRISYARFFFWRLKVKMKDYHEELDTRKTCMINPETVKYSLSPAFSRHQDQSTYVPVLSGDWDLHGRRIETLDEYKILEQELSESANVDRGENEMAVAVGRGGAFLLADGLRALLTAKKLQLLRTPARILARHKQWQELRKELFALSLEKHLYQPARHPDLDFPAEHSCADRFNIISENLSAQKGKLLDIGACLGYFSHRFEDAGFECYAVENSPRPLHYLKKLKMAGDKKFRIIPEDILEWNGYRGLQFDVVLALNVFHHFLKHEKTYAKLINLLNGLQMKELFFEPPLPNELKMKNAYKIFTVEEFVEFILERSGLKRVEPIGTAKDGRRLYRLN